jgi:hypothetical protein
LAAVKNTLLTLQAAELECRMKNITNMVFGADEVKIDVDHSKIMIRLQSLWRMRKNALRVKVCSQVTIFLSSQASLPVLASSVVSLPSIIFSLFCDPDIF